MFIFLSQFWMHYSLCTVVIANANPTANCSTSCLCSNKNMIPHWLPIRNLCQLYLMGFMCTLSGLFEQGWKIALILEKRPIGSHGILLKGLFDQQLGTKSGIKSSFHTSIFVFPPNLKNCNHFNFLSHTDIFLCIYYCHYHHKKRWKELKLPSLFLILTLAITSVWVPGKVIAFEKP